jgi:hypothetical protein
MTTVPRRTLTSPAGLHERGGRGAAYSGGRAAGSPPDRVLRDSPQPHGPTRGAPSCAAVPHGRQGAIQVGFLLLPGTWRLCSGVLAHKNASLLNMYAGVCTVVYLAVQQGGWEQMNVQGTRMLVCLKPHALLFFGWFPAGTASGSSAWQVSTAWLVLHCLGATAWGPSTTRELPSMLHLRATRLQLDLWGSHLPEGVQGHPAPCGSPTHSTQQQQQPRQRLLKCGSSSRTSSSRSSSSSSRRRARCRTSLQ